MSYQELQAHAFYATASPADVISRVAYYAAQDPFGAKAVWLSPAGPYVAIRCQNRRHSVAPTYCPYSLEEPLVIADPHPRVLRAYLGRLLRSAHVRGAWYERDGVQALIDAVRAAQTPSRPPSVPELPDDVRDWPEPRNGYQARVQRVRAAAHARGEH